MPKKTNLPHRIVAYLKRFPTASRQEISDALGVGYQAVQKHLRKLEEERLVKPGFLVSEKWEEGRHEFWIFIATGFRQEASGDATPADGQGRLCRALTAKLTTDEEYADLISFGSVRILLGGEWDILLQLFSNDPEAVGRFVTHYLRAQPAVQRTSVAWGLGQPEE